MRYLSVDELVAMAWTMTMIAVLFTLGRFAIHWRKTKRLGWDDILNGIAVLFLLAFIGTWQAVNPVEYQAQLYAMGLNKVNPVIRTELSYMINFAGALLFWCCIYSVKASFLALYWRIFEVSKTFRIAWILATVYTVLGFGITIMIRLFICGNPSNVLDQKKCRRNGKTRVIQMQVAWCVVDGVGDIILMLLPIMMLKGMLLRKSQKLQLGFLFGLVLINLVTSILRTVYTTMRDLKRFPQMNTAWVFLHITSAVVICSLPCYGTLFSGKKKSTSTRDLSSWKTSNRS